jgi:hypothetical protein
MTDSSVINALGRIGSGQGSAAPSHSLLNRLVSLNVCTAPAGGTPVRISSRVVGGGSAQAFVKIVRNGGTKNASQIKSQMDYLTRDGELEALRSERYSGTVIEGEDQDQMAQDWTVGPSRDAGLDLTTHFVVSFPPGTDVEAAERAGRAWADELFNSGDHGDVYDYYSVYHTDKPHPHMHVVAKRRGLENGEWLKISNRGEINYDVLRDVQVDAALEEGIELEATPRLARGELDRTPTDAEIRRAERENREPEARPHTAESADYAARGVWHYAEQIEHDAGVIRESMPDVAERMDRVADGLKAGSSVQETLRSEPPVDPGELSGMNQLIASHNTDVIEHFREIDAEISALPAESVDRAAVERRTADMRTNVGPFVATPDEFQESMRPDRAGRYHGIADDAADGGTVKAEADAQAAEAAQEGGLDSTLLLARYNGVRAVPANVADQWRDMERQELGQSANPPVDVEERLNEIHGRIEAIYGQARTASEIRDPMDVDGQILRQDEVRPAGLKRGREDSAEAETERPAKRARTEAGEAEPLETASGDLSEEAVPMDIDVPERSSESPPSGGQEASGTAMEVDAPTDHMEISDAGDDVAVRPAGGSGGSAPMDVEAAEQTDQMETGPGNEVAAGGDAGSRGQASADMDVESPSADIAASDPARDDQDEVGRLARALEKVRIADEPKRRDREDAHKPDREDRSRENRDR